MVKLLILKVAALTALLAGCGSITGDDNGSEDPGPMPEPPPRPAFQLTMEHYADCNALQSDFKSLLEEQRDYSRRLSAWQGKVMRKNQQSGTMTGAKPMSDSQVVTVTADAATEGGNTKAFTNVQEQGVDEADHVKVDDLHLYVVLTNRIEVVNRTSLALLGEIDTRGLTAVNLYAQGNRMTLVSNGTGGTASEVRIYDTSTAGMPTQTFGKTYPGTIKHSRSVGNHLVLVFSDYLPINGSSSDPNPNAPVPDAPILLDDQGRVAGVPCTSILKQSVRDFDFRVTRIISLNSTQPTEERAASIIGGGDQIYMSAKGLYVTKAQSQWGYGRRYDYNQQQTESLVITRVDFNSETGDVTPVASGMIAGRVKDQWAFKDFGDADALAVATSTGVLWSHGPDDPNMAQNHLWVLKVNPETHSLDVAAAIHNFGTGEDIRAIRYVGTMAYVVTFKKTDPLFAFDMSDPLDPKLLSELKVPGFSVYMHPVAPGLLVGVGFDAADQGDFAWYQGLQVSLFDVSNPLQMKRVDNKTIGTRGSSSDVTSDHHAFFYDPETRLMAIPVVELVGAREGTSSMGTQVAFSGAIIYGVDGALTEVGRISHQDLMPAACRSQLTQGQWWQADAASLDINRVFNVDGHLLSFSRFGIRSHALANPSLAEATVVFPGTESECVPPIELFYD